MEARRKYSVQNLITNLILDFVVNKIMALQDVYAFISITYEYITLHDKRDFAGVNKVMELKMGRVFWII